MHLSVVGQVPHSFEVKIRCLSFLRVPRKSPSVLPSPGTWANTSYPRFNEQPPQRGMGGGVSLIDKSWSHRYKLRLLSKGCNFLAPARKKPYGKTGRAPGFLLRSCTRLFRRYKGNKSAPVIGTKGTVVTRMMHAHQRANRERTSGSRNSIYAMINHVAEQSIVLKMLRGIPRPRL